MVRHVHFQLGLQTTYVPSLLRWEGDVILCFFSSYNDISPASPYNLLFFIARFVLSKMFYYISGYIMHNAFFKHLCIVGKQFTPTPPPPNNNVRCKPSFIPSPAGESPTSQVGVV